MGHDLRETSFQIGHVCIANKRNGEVSVSVRFTDGEGSLLHGGVSAPESGEDAKQTDDWPENKTMYASAVGG